MENEVRITFLYIYFILFTMQRKCWVLRFNFVWMTRRHLLNYLKPNEVTKVLFHTRNLCKAADKIMAATARWKTQGRSPGVRGARSRGMDNVATATCEPSKNGDVKRFETQTGDIRSPLTGPHSCATFVVKVIPQYCIVHPYCARFLRH